jgi:glycerol 3-phosphatase-2
MLAGSEAPLTAVHDVLVVDLDGVVYVGEHAVPGAVEAVEGARAAGLAVRFATNNASRTPQDVAQHLAELGVPAFAEDVVTSSQAAAALVREALGRDVRVLAVGGPGVPAAVREAGLVPVLSADDRPAAVVQGYGPHVGWRELTEIAFAVRAGALWVATNTDATLPTPRGPALGNGSLVAAVRTATGAEPLVAGKPEPALFDVASRGFRAPLVVGDRLDTDIAAAVRAGMPSLLVLTGVTGPRDLVDAATDQRPTFVAPDLSGLFRVHPQPRRDGDAWVCGTARAQVRDGVLLWEESRASGSDALDGLRAACAAAWDAGDAGRPVAWPMAEGADDGRRGAAGVRPGGRRAE